MSDIRVNKWEVLHYDEPDFQVMFRKNFIPAGIELRDITKHWHDDVEFIYVTKGSTFYEMEHETVKISAGEGIYVNAKQLHLIHAGDEDCELYCLIFHPIILCSSEYITSNLVMPILEDKAIPYVMLSENVDWQKSILEHIRNIEQYAEDAYGQLQIMKLLYEIWNEMFHNLISAANDDDEMNYDMAVIRRMTAFIHKNYRTKLKLQDICDAGSVGKTKCTELFTEYYHMSPMEYVRCYRIEKGAKLLEISDMSITEIAYETGFNDGSYFSKTFAQLIGCTPQEYRRYDRGLSRYYEKDRY